jgi:hypothetical protein
MATAKRRPRRGLPSRRSARAVRPEAEIRRFDVFAEWKRLEALDRLRLAPAQAKAYGLAVAKVVAGRRRRTGAARAPVTSWDEAPAEAGPRDRQDWWRFLGSAREFDDAIVRRMGRDFYRRVFGPALKKAWGRGLEYEGIRDSIRADWNRRQASTTL